MLRMPEFWATERHIPLMALNRDLNQIGFLDEHDLEPAFSSAAKLVTAFTKQLELENAIDWPTNIPPSRIITKDVERTFTATLFRNRMSNLLTILDKRFGDYHQGLSFLISFLMLFHEDNIIISIAERLNHDELFIPGYWKHEALAFAVDAHVFDHLLSIHQPEIHHHLAKISVMPGTYPQKWFVALCIHVLPFNALCLFLEQFFTHGVKFLFQFGLAFFQVIGPQILKTTNVVDIFAYLRLDHKVVHIEDHMPMEIIKRAKEVIIKEIDHIDKLKTIRKMMYDKHMGSRYEAMIQNPSADEDEDFDFSDEDAEAYPGSECQVCQNMVPDYWCFNCRLFICQMCIDDPKRHPGLSHAKVNASSAPASAYEQKKEAIEQVEQKVEDETELDQITTNIEALRLELKQDETVGDSNEIDKNQIEINT